jgi:Fe-Mn family superoxide dismutase
MSSKLFRAAPALRAALRTNAAPRMAGGIASTSFVRNKATLPDLPCK